LRSLFILIFIFCVSAVYAQKPKVKNFPNYDDRPIHFGFTVGLNTMDYSVRPANYNERPDTFGLIADVLNPQPGFHVQMVSSFKITEYITFRCLPGLSFGQRELNFNSRFGNTEKNHSMILESSYIEVPCLIKYRSKRVNNYGAYLIGGVNFRYDIAANKEYPESADVYMKVKPFDIAYEAGMGLDFYLPFFKFAVELKMSTGIFDILRHDYYKDDIVYKNSIDKLKSSLFMVSFHFE
jgi:hypothetical protein